MKNYITAAQTAYDQLSPLLAEAMTAAQEKLEQASNTASIAAQHKRLSDLINKVSDLPAPESVTPILATYENMIPKHRTRDGSYLIESLAGLASHHGLTSTQATKIAGAMLVAIRREAPESLVEWPDSNSWTSTLSMSDLRSWASWLDPVGLAKHDANQQRFAAIAIKAQNELLAQKNAQIALAGIVPSDANETIQIKNTAANVQTIAGIVFAANETKTLGSEEYCALSNHTAYRQMIDSGVIEVVV